MTKSPEKNATTSPSTLIRIPRADVLSLPALAAYLALTWTPVMTIAPKNALRPTPTILAEPVPPTT